MADEKDLKQAKTVLATFCQMLDENEWHYQVDEEDLSITCSAQGEDLPMELYISIDSGRDLITLYSKMPFVVAEDKRTDLALAVCKVNDSLANGSFDYNLFKGRIVFRMNSSYRESLIGKGLCKYMLYVSCQTIDEYNDKFFMISKGLLKIEDFLKEE